LPAAVLGIEDQAPILDGQPIHADDQNCSDVLPSLPFCLPIPITEYRSTTAHGPGK
jgi:hypothetical protein